MPSKYSQRKEIVAGARGWIECKEQLAHEK